VNSILSTRSIVSSIKREQRNGVRIIAYLRRRMPLTGALAMIIVFKKPETGEIWMSFARWGS